MSETPVIACEHLVKSFDGCEVLAGVSFSAQAGETVAVSGASGSGKTTLLHLLGGLDGADGGTISVCGKAWSAMSARKAAVWRNLNLGFVFQFHLLLPEFSALENAAMPLLIRGVAREEALTAASERMTLLGVGDCVKKTPGQMSGGERQRTAVARALCGNPSCILADEPTGNLDRKNADKVFDLMLETAAQQNAAVIIASHDERLAARASRRAALIDGKLQE